jgi:ribosomal protein L17
VTITLLCESARLYSRRLQSAIMAGGAIKYRHLSRKSSHRQALLRNLVTSLIEHESITTTWPKAKEAQRMAEKLITLGKRNTQAARNKVQGMTFVYLSIEWLEL